MKKMIICVLLFATAFLSYGQMNPTPVNENPTNQQIVDLLNMSLNANGAYTIEDINNGNLHVGDPFVFVRKSGLNVVFTTGLGDNPWTMGKKVLKFQNDNPNDPIVNSDQTKPVVPEEVIQEKKDPSFFTNSRDGRPWWILWIALGIVLFLFIFSLIKKAIKTKKEKAVKAEEQPALIPLVADGVSDAQAPAYMQSVARRKNYTITGPTERILLTTVRPITMDYYGGVTRPEEFVNEPFYRAAARNNTTGQPCFAYFRQTCGNDGTVLSESDIVVTPITEQSPAIRQANASVGTPMQPVAAQQQSVQPVVAESSFMKLARIVDESLQAGEEVLFTASNSEINLSIKDAAFGVNGHKPIDLVKKEEKGKVEN
jgi:hypothetical protein